MASAHVVIVRIPVFGAVTLYQTVLMQVSGGQPSSSEVPAWLGSPGSAVAVAGMDSKATGTSETAKGAVRADAKSSFGGGSATATPGATTPSKQAAISAVTTRANCSVSLTTHG